MQVHITLQSEHFEDDHEQEVLVRTDLTIGALLNEIIREYHFEDSDYQLKMPGATEALPLKQSISELGIRTGAVLVFTRSSVKSLPSRVTGKTQAGLRSQSGESFILRRDRALIGRPNARTQLTADKLDVDLSPLDPSRTSSRPHAQIERQSDGYYLRSLRDDNPTFVNNEPVLPGTARKLISGEWLRFGSVQLQFYIDKDES